MCWWTPAPPGRCVREERACSRSGWSRSAASLSMCERYAKPVRGHVLVDAGAARALREGGTSLLPVGVVEVGGEFDAGDAVEVSHADQLVGKGICNYSSAELRRVCGLKSAEVRALL